MPVAGGGVCYAGRDFPGGLEEAEAASRLRAPGVVYSYRFPCSPRCCSGGGGARPAAPCRGKHGGSEERFNGLSSAHPLVSPDRRGRYGKPLSWRAFRQQVILAADGDRACGTSREICKTPALIGGPRWCLPCDALQPAWLYVAQGLPSCS